MRLICTHENIKLALRDLESISSRNITLPILENILIEAKEGLVFFSATNLELGVIKKVKAKIEQEGGIVISTNLLKGFLTALRGESHITLTVEDNNLICESGSYKTKIKGFSTDDFPIIPQNISDKKISITLNELQDLIKNVFPFTTQNEIRPELTGVYIYTDGNEIISAATDSFRLGEKRKDVKDIILGESDYSDFNIILPQKLCSYILKLQGESQLIECFFEDNHMFINYDELIITARLIDGKYPDYKQIIPQNTKTNTIIKREDLKEAMRVMLVFSDQNTSEASLKISQEGFFIETVGSISGEGQTKIQGSIDGEDQLITINPKYILDGISQMSLEDVYIGVNNESSPIILYQANTEGVDKSYTYIVMPVKSSHK